MSATPVAPQALKAWAVLRFAMNHNLARDLTNASKIRAATLRELGRG